MTIYSIYSNEIYNILYRSCCIKRLMNSLRGDQNMTITVDESEKIDVKALNEDIEKFPQVYPITEDMHIMHSGVSRLVILDCYALKDTEKKPLIIADFDLLPVKA